VQYTLDDSEGDAEFVNITLFLDDQGSDANVTLPDLSDPNDIESADGTDGHITVDGDNVEIDNVANFIESGDGARVEIELTEPVVAEADGSGIEFNTINDGVSISDNSEGEAEATLTLEDADGNDVGDTELADENLLEYDTT